MLLQFYLVLKTQQISKVFALIQSNLSLTDRIVIKIKLKAIKTVIDRNKIMSN